jgi:hypothetical protein
VGRVRIRRRGRGWLFLVSYCCLEEIIGSMLFFYHLSMMSCPRITTYLYTIYTSILLLFGCWFLFPSIKTTAPLDGENQDGIMGLIIEMDFWLCWVSNIYYWYSINPLHSFQFYPVIRFFISYTFFKFVNEYITFIFKDVNYILWKVKEEWKGMEIPINQNSDKTNLHIFLVESDLEIF